MQVSAHQQMPEEAQWTYKAYVFPYMPGQDLQAKLKQAFLMCGGFGNFITLQTYAKMLPLSQNWHQGQFWINALQSPVLCQGVKNGTKTHAPQCSCKPTSYVGEITLNGETKGIMVCGNHRIKFEKGNCMFVHTIPIAKLLPVGTPGPASQGKVPAQKRKEPAQEEEVPPQVNAVCEHVANMPQGQSRNAKKPKHKPNNHKDCCPNCKRKLTESKKHKHQMNGKTSKPQAHTQAHNPKNTNPKMQRNKHQNAKNTNPKC